MPIRTSFGRMHSAWACTRARHRARVLLMTSRSVRLDVQTRDLLQTSCPIWQPDRKTVLFVTTRSRRPSTLADRIVLFTPRPARIDRVLSVRLRVRADEDVKATPAFVELRREIWQSLKHGRAV